MNIEEFDKPFDELVCFVQQNEIIQNTEIFLQECDIYISPKIFLSFCMIYYHNDLVDNDDELSNEFLKQVKRTMRVYISLKQEYKDYKLYIFRYVMEETKKWFDIWKKLDKYKLIMPMIYMYHHLETQKTHGHDWNMEICKQQKLIKSKILKIDPDAHSLLENPPRVQLDANKDNVVRVIHKAYWDNFKDSIRNKEWGQLIGFVEEIKQMIKDLIPHRGDMHQEIDEKLDTVILQQRLENDKMSLHDIFELMSYLVQWLQQLQAPIDDSDTIKWWDHVQQQTAWDIMMCDFFMILFAKLDKVYKTLDKIKYRY